MGVQPPGLRNHRQSLTHAPEHFALTTKVLHRSATIRGMASRYPRLGVTRDPEVQRALTLTEPLLEPAETRSAAAQIRALTLRGAQAVLAGSAPDSQLQARLAERYGARPGRGGLQELDPPPGEPDPSGEAPASKALRWVRGE